MRIYVTKPRNGRVSLRLDDSHGATRLRETKADVPIEDVGAEAAILLAKWEERRNSIIQATRPAPG